MKKGFGERLRDGRRGLPGMLGVFFLIALGLRSAFPEKSCGRRIIAGCFGICVIPEERNEGIRA